MSVLPFLLDLNDQYANLNNFGFSICPRDLCPKRITRHRPLFSQPWILVNPDNVPAVKRNRKDPLGSSITKDGFQMCIDVQEFSPNEISVKTVDNTIVVEGKHEEREDDHGFISRQFTRRYILPEEFDIKDVVSTLSSDGVLTIKAPPPAKAIEGNERVVQIQQTGPAHLNVKVTEKETLKDAEVKVEMTDK